MSQLAREVEFLSFERYLTDPSIDPHSEWVDGQVVPMHAVADRHDAMVGWLRSLLDGVVRERDLGRVLGEPFVMKTGPDLPGRSPDLMFVAAEHADRIRARHLEGPADLVIEVLSPESKTRDGVHKLAEYERGGVPEYWLIDPEAGHARFYCLGADGRYAEESPESPRYRSRVLPLVQLERRWLMQRPLPKTLAILRGWGVI